MYGPQEAIAAADDGFPNGLSDLLPLILQHVDEVTLCAAAATCKLLLAAVLHGVRCIRVSVDILMTSIPSSLRRRTNGGALERATEGVHLVLFASSTDAAPSSGRVSVGALFSSAKGGASGSSEDYLVELSGVSKLTVACGNRLRLDEGGALRRLLLAAAHPSLTSLCFGMDRADLATEIPHLSQLDITCLEPLAPFLRQLKVQLSSSAHDDSETAVLACLKDFLLKAPLLSCLELRLPSGDLMLSTLAALLPRTPWVQRLHLTTDRSGFYSNFDLPVIRHSSSALSYLQVDFESHFTPGRLF